MVGWIFNLDQEKLLNLPNLQHILNGKDVWSKGDGKETFYYIQRFHSTILWNGIPHHPGLWSEVHRNGCLSNWALLASELRL